MIKMTAYEKAHLKRPFWVEIHKYVEDGTVSFLVTQVSGGFSREGRSFNEYEKNLLLVIQGKEKDVKKLTKLLWDKMILREPNELQGA